VEVIGRRGGRQAGENRIPRAGYARIPRREYPESGGNGPGVNNVDTRRAAGRYWSMVQRGC